MRHVYKAYRINGFIFNAMFMVISNLAYAQSGHENVIFSPQIQSLNQSTISDAKTIDAPSTAITFEEAQNLLHARSDKLKALDMSVQSAELRRKGMDRLGGPSVAVTGLGYAYSMHVDVNLDPARNALHGAAQQLPPQLGGAVSQIPNLPSHYKFKHNGENASIGVSAVWPIYTGGFPDAIRGELGAMSDETKAIASADRNALNTLLVERYFNAQLARLTAMLYAQTLEAVKAHDEGAQKMLENGVISNIERLEAKAALAHAKDIAKQAQDTAGLANTALSRTIQAGGVITPTTPLFLNSQALPPLEHFIEMAYRQHPAIQEIEAKKQQAGYLYDAQDALRKPQVLAFANHDVGTISDGDSNWIAGLAVRWSLWSDIDRQALMNASLRQIDQADFTLAQALNDIALLVEQNWLNVAHARERYEAQKADENLAYELLKLRKVGLREGTSTPLDLIDAELNLARVKTERAMSANQYVQSLAALLQSAGAPQEFGRFMQQANIQISKELL